MVIGHGHIWTPILTAAAFFKLAGALKVEVCSLASQTGHILSVGNWLETSELRCWWAPLLH